MPTARRPCSMVARPPFATSVPRSWPRLERVSHCTFGSWYAPIPSRARALAAFGDAVGLWFARNTWWWCSP